jgi:hypothetical protein
MDDNRLLESQAPTNGQDGMDTDSWRQVVKLIERGKQDRDKKIEEIKIITEEYEKQGELVKPSAKKHISGTTMVSALLRTSAKMKVLKNKVYLHGAPPIFNRIVSNAINLGIQETGLLYAFTSRFGVFNRVLLHGDAFVMARRNEDEEGGVKNNEYPIKFDMVDCENVYLDPFAVDIQSQSDYQDCDSCLLTFDYEWDEFLRIFPYAKGVAASGRLPMTKDQYEREKTTWDQESSKEDRIVEAGYYFSKSQNKSVIFAGRQASVIDESEGTILTDSDKNNILPLFQFICFPTPRGIYNWGLMHLLLRIHNTMQVFINASTSSVVNRLDPLYYANLKSEEVQKLNERIEQALYDHANTGFGIVAFDKGSGIDAPTKIEALLGDQLTGDFERIMQTYKNEVLQLGINLDDIPQATVDTATQATLREQATNAIVLQIMEGNGFTFKKIYELIANSIRDLTAEDNSYTLRFDEKFTEEELTDLQKFVDEEIGAGQINVKERNLNITLGFVSRILKKWKCTIDVELRSGAYPDIVSELARTKELVDIFSAIAPGSPAHKKMIQKLAKISGESFGEGDFSVPQAEQPQQ